MTTRELRPDDIRTGQAYEAVRADARYAVAEAQQHRRVQLGETLCLVFESRESIRASLEEMLRAERITDPVEVEQDVEAFNAFVPGPRRLGATLYVEASDPADLGALVPELRAVLGTLFVEVGGEEVRAARLDDAESPEAAASFVVFDLNDDQARRWRGGSSVAVGVRHPRFATTVALTEEQTRAIGAEL